MGSRSPPDTLVPSRSTCIAARATEPARARARCSTFHHVGGALQAPIRTQLPEKNSHEHERSLGEWHAFTEDVRSYYDVDLTCMTRDYEQEQHEYLHQTASWSDVHPGNLLGKTAVIKTFDLRTIGLDDVKGAISADFELLVTRTGPIQGLLGFFDSSFEGSPENPTEHKVRARAGYTQPNGG